LSGGIHVRLKRLDRFVASTAREAVRPKASGVAITGTAVTREAEEDWGC
jgi:hypothetical protein